MKNLFSIEGKVALVTGGSRGIGLMIARGYVENGATVYISSRKADVCDQVAAELSRHGTCRSLPADLGSEAGANGLAAALAAREPPVTSATLPSIENRFFTSGPPRTSHRASRRAGAGSRAAPGA